MKTKHSLLTFGSAALVLLLGISSFGAIKDPREFDKKLLSQYFQPTHEADLPSDISPVTLEYARRAFLDEIQVFQTDANQAQEKRFSFCTTSWLEGSEVPKDDDVPLTLKLIQKVPQWLGPPKVIYSSAIPLRDPLSKLATWVKLTPAELKALENLRTTEIEDVADRTQLSIDTESFLMRVSARLYDNSIDAHLEVSQKNSQDLLVSEMDRNRELCKAYNLRAEKDQQMTEAAKRALSFYDELTSEMRVAHLF